jgi:hypothetical protein
MRMQLEAIRMLTDTKVGRALHNVHRDSLVFLSMIVFILAKIKLKVNKKSIFAMFLSAYARN